MKSILVPAATHMVYSSSYQSLFMVKRRGNIEIIKERPSEISSIDSGLNAYFKIYLTEISSCS